MNISAHDKHQTALLGYVAEHVQRHADETADQYQARIERTARTLTPLERTLADLEIRKQPDPDREYDVGLDMWGGNDAGR